MLRKVRLVPFAFHVLLLAMKIYALPFIKLITTLLVWVFPSMSLAKDFKVIALFWSSTIEGQVAMKMGVEETLSQFNKKNSNNKIILKSFIAGDGKEGVKNQLEQFRLAIDSKPDLIIIQPTDNATMSASLKRANSKKIPVIAYDQFISGGQLLSFVTSDNYQAGSLNAEYIDSLFPSGKSIRIVLVEYPRVSSTSERVDGFFDQLKRLDRPFEVQARYEAVEPIGGLSVAKQILQQFPTPNSFDVLFTINDGGGISIVEELRKAGRLEIKHATVDGDPKSIENIKKSQMTVINSAQFCAEIGRQTAKLAISHLVNKETLPKKVLIPTFPVTKETLSRYDGWLGQMPTPFIKPWTKKKELWKSELKKLY